MNNDKLNSLIEAHNIYHNGLIAEDKAYSLRSNTLLTFNSILALAFVGILNFRSESDWKLYMYYSIPIFAVLINVIWSWLGCRTMLAFIFYFKMTEKIEDAINKDTSKENDYLKYFNYAKARKLFWKENRKGITSFVSVWGGANKIFCFIVPQLIYLFWLTLLLLVVKSNNCFIAISISSLGIFILAMFILIMIQILKNTKEFSFPEPVE